MEGLGKDIRYAVRSLLKYPGFVLISVFTLALGIGVNTAIFSVVNALLLKPLPYPHPEQLVSIGEVTPSEATEMIPGAHFLEWHEKSKTLEKIAVYNARPFNLTGTGDPERLEGAQVSADFFATLGVPAFYGRTFLPGEDRPGGDRLVVLSHSFWQRRFNADRNVVGQSITLDDQPYTVVGVLPVGFRFSQPAELWVPIALDSQQERGNEQITILNAIGRIKAGASLPQAQAELEALRSVFENTKLANMPLFSGQVQLIPLHQKVVGDTKRLLLILLGAVGLVLLIACANVANLQLSRAVARRREFAIRSGLGAGRLRLIRQMLTESWLLALAGGALGLLLANWLTQALVALAASKTFGEISQIADIRMDLTVLGFTLLASVVAGTLFGLAPAFQLSRPEVSELLKDGSHGTSLYPSRLRSVLMVSEVALAILLLVGAGLLIRSFANLLEVNPGYTPDNLLTMRVSLPQLRYDQTTQRVNFYREVLERTKSLPGVTEVGAINHLPLTDFSFGGWLRVPGRPPVSTNDQPPTPIGVVSPGYFRTMGIPVRAGRVFSDRDNSDSPRAVILSEALAQTLFPNEDPIGKKVWVPGVGKDVPTVIGIVGDVRHEGLDKEITPEAYESYLQQGPGSMTMVIRTSTNPSSVATAIRGEVRQVDRNVPIFEVQTMSQRLSTSVSPRRFNLFLLGLFAALALALAALGIYGVISYAVTQRTHEIGIRLALGAKGSDVLRLLVGHGMFLVGIGVTLGLIGAWALTRVMSSFLFGVRPTDATTFAAVSAVQIIVAFLACYLPARRAAKIDAMVALRYE